MDKESFRIDTDEIKMIIGDRIKKMREASGLSQKDLAKELGISIQAVSSWELGNRTPRMPQIKKIAALFDVSESYLIGESESKKAPSFYYMYEDGPVMEDFDELTEDNKSIIIKLYETVLEQQRNKDKGN